MPTARPVILISENAYAAKGFLMQFLYGFYHAIYVKIICTPPPKGGAYKCN